MAGKVKLSVTQGSMKGKLFAFSDHDTFLFGRMDDCHACLPEDSQVSRHHFILEVNPPDARLRDLGSLNGTYVNHVKHGGRAKDETPEQGAQRRYPEVALKHGDEIVVGQTALCVSVEFDAICCECDSAIPDSDRASCAWVGGTFLCPSCKLALERQAHPPKAPEPLRCEKCGKDVSAEIGEGRRGACLCNACQQQAEADPLQLLEHLFDQAAVSTGKSIAVPGYEIERKLKVGGFGAVYLAKRRSDASNVAIKVMLSRIAVDKKSRDAFLREIDTMKTLKHRHIVTVLESGSAGTAFYFVMEYCDGGSVGDLLRSRGGKLPVSEAGPLMLDALDGLAFAHRQGFVHRDLKPDNLLLVTSRKRKIAKVSDFGLAKNFESAGFSGHTVTGSFGGTPSYMPREQVVNFKRMKPASDVWSMAATLYNMLTGQTPRNFRRDVDPIQIILQDGTIPIRERNAKIPHKIAEVIDRCLSNDLKERYQNADQMRAALTKVL
jgi:serine/threonine-protein kinase